MKRILATIVFFISVIYLANAQDYKWGLGLRAGLGQGLTVKHFVSHKSALEGLFATRWRGFEATALYELHNIAFDVERLNWYFGLGGHLGFWNGDYTKGWGDPGTNYTVIGIDGIIGIEYNFREAPINLGIDWKPAFNLVGNGDFWYDGVAISIRYIF